MFQKFQALPGRLRLILIILPILIIGGLLAFAITRYNANRTSSTPTRVDTPTGTTGVGTTTGGGIAGTGGDSESRLQFRLSEGQEKLQASEGLVVVNGTPLDPAEIAQIIARLPELTTEQGDVLTFNLPDELIPPPLTGETVEEVFPPLPTDFTPPTVVDGPLEVVRFSPEGEINLAPFLNVTFNQPMVPLTALEDLNVEDVPVRLTPAIPGRWQWISPQILRFEYESDDVDRFPMATEFVVEVPAGTQSATGNTLDTAVSWTFSTPAPRLLTSYPHGNSQPVNPLIFLEFDQRIDPNAILPTLQLTADRNNYDLRLATDEEIAGDETIARYVEFASEDRWLVMRPTTDLPSDSGITLTIGPGTPSAEGPRTTTESQLFGFRTYAPLQIDGQNCGERSDECLPLMPLWVYFNNPLDPETFNENMVTISPELPGATVRVQGSSLVIEGNVAGQTNYTVRLAETLPDRFGQTLGDEESVTFRVGSARPFLSGNRMPLITVDPSLDQPTYTVYSMNMDRLEVTMYAVEPSDWPNYLTYMDNLYREDRPTPPGRELYNETITLDSEEDILTETSIDLRPALEGSEHGHIIITVQPTGRDADDYFLQNWVQITDIGLDLFVDNAEMFAWATDLATGTPLENVTISALPTDRTFTTSADGTVRFPIPAGGVTSLVATQGDDTALLPNNPYWRDGRWESYERFDWLQWFVFDDRQLYRPGEEVHIKGWLRYVENSPTGDLRLVGDRVNGIDYVVWGPQGNELTTGRADVTALGGFDFTITLPDNVNLGYVSIDLNATGNLNAIDGRNHYHSFQIQEFRRPEFEVTARNETSGPYFENSQATLSTSADYFAGGPLANAVVNWTVTSTPTSYSPPNWSGFSFGTWTPWWHFDYGYDVLFEEEYFFPPQPFDENFESFTGITDPAGTHYLQIDFDNLEGNRPFSVVANASVEDVNRQAWSASTSLLVHPSAYYVGLRSERTFVQKGQPLDIEAIVTDLDGNPIVGTPITLQASRLEWQLLDGRWQEVPVGTQDCTVTSAEEPVTCTFITEEGGSYLISATVTDGEGRTNQSEMTRWVSGGSRPTNRNVEQESVTIIPDKAEYEPGDTAQLLIQPPFTPAEALVTVSRGGTLYTEQFRIESDTHTLSIPISDEHIPNLSVQVDLVGSAPRTDALGDPITDLPARPAFARGNIDLNIPPYSRTLTVEATPQDDALEPGASTVLDVVVTDANGQPVSNAELAVVVVDEAILALSNYQLADPLGLFYMHRYSYVEGYYGRTSLVLANPTELAQQVERQNEVEVQATTVASLVVEGEAVMDSAANLAFADGDEAMEEAADFEVPAPTVPVEQEGEAITVRTNFNPLATFAPAVTTDSNGRAQVDIDLPDNLTRYRIMVVAVAGDNQFGSTESSLTARLPLMVRPSAPRFLNFGDVFEFPVVVQNQTDAPMEVSLVVETTNLNLLDASGVRVTVPANDRVEVRFPAGTVSPGTARFQIAAVSGDFADAASAELPVYTPATTEAFAIYGTIEEGAVAQPIALPSNIYTEFGGLEINTSSTALQSLTDAVLYLSTYRYETPAPLASRILAIASLRDVLSAFEADGLPDPAGLESQVNADLATLQSLQNFDGGFGTWRRGQESYPYISLHVAHALVQAQEKGFTIPDDMLFLSLDYLNNIERHYPSYYSEHTRNTLSAYALHIRYLAGDSDVSKAQNLVDQAGLDNLSLEAVAWLWPTLQDTGLSDDISRLFTNRAVETASAANFTTSYGDEAYLMLHSNRRTDGVILDALITVEPDNDLIPKVVNGLLAHRTRGHWGSTQENTFILLALDSYFNTFEAETPDFVARIWLGETYAGEHAYEGRTTERHETLIPMDFMFDILPDSFSDDLVIGMEGAGRLYYRLGMNYAPDDLNLEALDRGFTVLRTYEAVDDPNDVYQDEDGVWHFKAGARVRVRVTMVTDNRRYHVALVDAIPAGLEILNPSLAVTEDIPSDPSSEANRNWWWWGTWYQHQNLRDERAEAFTTLLWEGVYDYSYVTRATTPGTFVVPPAKAEEMYSPEVFGRSSSDWVIIEE